MCVCITEIEDTPNISEEMLACSGRLQDVEFIKRLWYTCGTKAVLFPPKDTDANGMLSSVEVE